MSQDVCEPVRRITPRPAPPVESTSCTVSVVICTYADWRWADLERSCTSVLTQLAPGDDLIIVVDHNDALLDRANRELRDVLVIANSDTRGLSGARNTGVRAAAGDVIAFLDDDASARAGWLAALRSEFGNGRVSVVGTAVQPRWEGGLPPRWFPPEFGWVVGCSYRGLPESKTEIRNPIGASMAIRRGVFDSAGMFSDRVGRLGTTPVGCEETEFCIRAAATLPDSRIVFEPAAVVDHWVPAARQTLRYFISRCYHEGRSKRFVTQLQGANSGLSTERRYVRVVLPIGVLRGVAGGIRRPAELMRAGAIVLGLASTIAGFLAGAPRTSHVPVPGTHRPA